MRFSDDWLRPYHKRRGRQGVQRGENGAGANLAAGRLHHCAHAAHPPDQE